MADEAKTIDQLPLAEAIDADDHIVLEKGSGTHKAPTSLLRLNDIETLMSYQYLDEYTYPASAFSWNVVPEDATPLSVFGDLTGLQIAINGTEHTFSATPATLHELLLELLNAFPGINFMLNWGSFMIESFTSFELSGTALAPFGFSPGLYEPENYADAYIARAYDIYFDAAGMSLDSEIQEMRWRLDTLEANSGSGGGSGGSVDVYEAHSADSVAHFPDIDASVVAIFGPDILDRTNYPFAINGVICNPLPEDSSSTVREWIGWVKSTIENDGLDFVGKIADANSFLSIEARTSQNSNAFTVSGAGAELFGFVENTYEGGIVSRYYDLDASKIYVPSVGAFLDDYITSLENRLRANGI